MRESKFSFFCVIDNLLLLDLIRTFDYHSIVHPHHQFLTHRFIIISAISHHLIPRRKDEWTASHIHICFLSTFYSPNTQDPEAHVTEYVPFFRLILTFGLHGDPATVTCYAFSCVFALSRTGFWFCLCVFLCNTFMRGWSLAWFVTTVWQLIVRFIVLYGRLRLPPFRLTLFVLCMWWWCIWLFTFLCTTVTVPLFLQFFDSILFLTGYICFCACNVTWHDNDKRLPDAKHGIQL